MHEILKKSLRVLGLTALIVGAAGCACLPCEKKAGARPAPKPAARRVVTSAGCPSVVQQGGMLLSSMAVPTGETGSSVLLLERSAPVEAALGKVYEYTIKATNLTDCPLDDVVVTDTLMLGDFALKGSAPQAQIMPDGRARWELGTIGGGAAKTIRVQGVANKTGEIVHCFNATYVQNLCQTVRVIEPALKLVKTAPAGVILCEQIPMRIVVSNPGTGAVRDVVVTDTLPAGLVTLDGQRSASFNAGTLNAGEAREFSLIAKAERTGQFTNTASAKSAEGLTAEDSATVTVTQPVLTIESTCTDMVFAGRPATYTIKVCNTGDAVAKDVVLTDTLPAGVAFASASGGGTAAAGTVVWNLGDIAPKGCKEVSVNVNTVAIGTAKNMATAQAECAAPVSTDCVTEIKGIPAILLEVVDHPDPIEVGSETTYTITATNQGSATGTNIRITCKLEAAQDCVSATGATKAVKTGQVVEFAPLPSLAPKAQATWNVVVKAAKAGDIRFSVEMNTDQIERPVNETEATNQY